MAVPKDGTADYPLGASVIALAPGPLTVQAPVYRDRVLQRWCARAESHEGKGVPPSAMAVRGAPTVEKPPARKGLARTSGRCRGLSRASDPPASVRSADRVLASSKRFAVHYLAAFLELPRRRYRLHLRPRPLPCTARCTRSTFGPRNPDPDRSTT
jgi:hypothetical protein